MKGGTGSILGQSADGVIAASAVESRHPGVEIIGQAIEHFGFIDVTCDVIVNGAECCCWRV